MPLCRRIDAFSLPVVLCERIRRHIRRLRLPVPGSEVYAHVADKVRRVQRPDGGEDVVADRLDALGHVAVHFEDAGFSLSFAVDVPRGLKEGEVVEVESGHGAVEGVCDSLAGRQRCKRDWIVGSCSHFVSGDCSGLDVRRRIEILVRFVYAEQGLCTYLSRRGDTTFISFLGSAADALLWDG